MKIEVKLFASLRIDRFKAAVQNYAAGTIVEQIADKLKITRKDSLIILVNGKHSTLNHCLNDGDTVSFLPLIGGG